jgi:hypothetical protein
MTKAEIDEQLERCDPFQLLEFHYYTFFALTRRMLDEGHTVDQIRAQADVFDSLGRNGGLPAGWVRAEIETRRFALEDAIAGRAARFELDEARKERPWLDRLDQAEPA